MDDTRFHTESNLRITISMLFSGILQDIGGDDFWDAMSKLDKNAESLKAQKRVLKLLNIEPTEEIEFDMKRRSFCVVCSMVASKNIVTSIGY